MEVMLALKDAIESDARMDAKVKKQWIDFLVTTRKEFYNRWVKEDVHKALFVSFQDEAQELLDKYLDEVEAVLETRRVDDPITGEERNADEDRKSVVQGKSVSVSVNSGGCLYIKKT